MIFHIKKLPFKGGQIGALLCNFMKRLLVLLAVDLSGIISILR